MFNHNMITLKELDYVDLWANRIPMPGEEYCKQVVFQMKECYEIYKQKYQNKEYCLTFSNGEEITFSIIAANLCHMLGIDYKNIKGEFFDDYRRDVLKITSCNFTSFDLLESILEYSDDVIIKDNDPGNRAKVINYYKSQIKCNIFRKLSDFEKFDFCAINYDPKDGKYEYDKQKLFFVPSNESICPYFFMGIRLGDNPELLNGYIVSTLMAPREFDVEKYFDGQEVILPTQILVSDNSELRKHCATADEKIRLLTMYKAIINKYNISNMLNISGDYEAMLNILSSYENKKLEKTL